MADSSPERIVVSCSCGAKLRVAATSIGKKAKCPKCGGVISITAPVKTKQPAKKPAVAPPAEEPGDFLDELASLEQNAEATETGRPCPKCGNILGLGMRTCSACGHDTRKARPSSASSLLPSSAGKAEGPVPQPARQKSSFLRGCAFCLAGAAIGAVVWGLIGAATNSEIGFIAWGVGILAGIGMTIGYKDRTSEAGSVAALIAVVGILLGKALALLFMINAAMPSEADKMELRKEHLVVQKALAILNDTKTDPAEEEGKETEPTDEEWESALAAAAMQIVSMSDEEVTERLKELHESPDEEGTYAEATRLMEEAYPPIPVGSTFTENYSKMFGLFDLLWIFLALSSAYRIASGGSETT